MIYSYFSHANKMCMSYFTHWRLSMYFAGFLFIGSIKAIIHAFIPRFCTTSTRDLTHQITETLNNSGCKDKLEETTTPTHSEDTQSITYFLE